ncbi:hypothetical protein [Gordonia hirsuta]|nr:hypothetical protein [Gordonia hirsuta]
MHDVPAPQQTPASPQPPHVPRPEARARLTGALTSRAWISVAAVVSALSLVVASWVYFGGGPGTTNGGLEVAAVSMDSVVEIPATTRSTATRGENAPISTPQKTVPVDITLKNTCSMPIIVKEIRGEVLHFAELPDCGRFGGGPAVLSASFGLVIPTTFRDDARKPTTTQIAMPADFVVEPGSVGRMEVTFGPETQNSSFVKPNIMAVKISLVPDVGEPLLIGTAGGVSQVQDVVHMAEHESYFARPQPADCNRANLREVLKVTRSSDVRSPYLTQMEKIYAKYA